MTNWVLRGFVVCKLRYWRNVSHYRYKVLMGIMSVCHECGMGSLSKLIKAYHIDLMKYAYIWRDNTF